MTSGTASSILASARRHRAEADDAERALLEDAIAWAAAHEVAADGSAATWGDTPVPIAGEGAPHISEFCIAEFAAALRISTDSGRILLAEAVELAHRLPRVIGQVRAGRLRVWKARQIAAATLALSPEAAVYVDHAVSFSAHKIGTAALQRLVDEAIARCMPETAAERAQQAADQRCVRIDHQQVSFHGTSRIQGELDLADALDLDRALQAGAARLAELGSTASLDVRRSLALGALARGDQTLVFDAPQREVVLHVHLQAGADPSHATTDDLGGTAFVESHRRLLTVEQIREWTRTAGKVTVRPVLDLHRGLSTEGYAIPERIREHVIARDRTCIFPDCERRARSADLDHIQPYDAGGDTSTDNLAPLCRRHHRLKTCGGWTYLMHGPGTYLWRSPHGLLYLRDRTGTTALTPRPVEPPGRRTA